MACIALASYQASLLSSLASILLRFSSVKSSYRSNQRVFMFISLFRLLYDISVVLKEQQHTSTPDSGQIPLRLFPLHLSVSRFGECVFLDRKSVV